MSTPSKPHQKDAPWMDDKYLPPSREKTGVSNEREHSDRYRRWSPSRRNASSSRPKSDWKYDQNRERYQKRQHWSYHSKPYRYGERRWYDDSYTPNAGPHPSARADSQQRDVQPSASSSSANVPVSKSPGSKPSIIIKKVKKFTKPKPGPCSPPPAKEDFTMNQFIAEHLKSSLFYMPQSEPMMHTHNALISKIIADEAIKMLSSAASSNEPSSLNEPCEKAANQQTPHAAGSSNDTTPAPEGNDTGKPATSASATADSALLQKSAEQVTRKLINQLTTMNKYNLKQMIDNPAGKYETALNKHAQSKLRAEVRKQLKNFNLADAVRAKDSSFGSDVMAPDEAIDAEKIPAELLEQIGKALDFDFYDLSGPEPRDSTEGNAECSIVVEPSTDKANNEGASATQQAEKQTMENGNNGAGNLAPHAVNSPHRLVTASAGVEAGPHPLPAETTPPAKTVSFLRVSTVDELNKRLETSAEDIAASSAIPQPTFTASDMLATSGAMVIPEIGSTLAEPTVSPLLSGPSRNASNAPLDCPPLAATTESFSLPSVQSSSTINPMQIEASVAVGTKGPAQQLASLPGKPPNKGKQKPSAPLNGKCGSQENNSPAQGKKKTKGPKKNPKQNINHPPSVENGTTVASAETIVKQPKPAKKSDQRPPPSMPFPPTGSVSICENYSGPNNKPSDDADTSAPNDHGSRGSGDLAKQRSPKRTSNVSRWDSNNGAGNLAPHAVHSPYQLVTALAGVEAGPHPLPAETTPPAKTVSFLRVSTVDELNKRLETSAEDIAAISAIPQPTFTASDMLATSGAMVIPEIGSTLAEPTVSPLLSGSSRNASNAPLDCPPLAATTESFSLPSVQSSSTINPTQIEPSVAVGTKGPAQQLASLPGKPPNKGKQKPSPPLNGKCGSQENNSPAQGKKKTKGPKKNPKQNINHPPSVENGTTVASAETIVKQRKPSKKSDQRPRPLMPFPPTESVSICENYSWPNNIPSDGADTSAPNHPAKQRSPKRTSKVSRWDRENVVRSAAIGATNGECNLRTKTPEPVPISSRSPQVHAMRNGNGKRGRRCYPPCSKIKEQRTNGMDGSAGKNSTSWNSPKRRRVQQQEPLEVPTAGNVVDESASKEVPVQPENEAKQADNGSEMGTVNEKEQGTGTEIRISNVRSLVDVTPPAESENSLVDESIVSAMEHSANAASVNTNEHATVQVVLNGGMQLVPGHANGLGVDNTALSTQPDQAMGELIVPDLMSAPRLPLGTILDQMQSLDTQTMELFKRKMDLDAEIMKLNGERMEIDQAIVKLQNARDEQMNTLRFALFLPFSSAGGVQHNCPPIPVSLSAHGEQVQDSLFGEPHVGNGQVDEKNVIGSTVGSDGPQNTQPQQAASNQQERTIRRITKISGNSELMRIFQRRRLLSERSSDENPPADDSGSIPNELPMDDELRRTT